MSNALLHEVPLGRPERPPWSSYAAVADHSGSGLKHYDSTPGILAYVPIASGDAYVTSFRNDWFQRPTPTSYYDLKIVNIDVSGNQSEPSDPVAIFDATSPAPVVNLAAGTATESLTLTWTAPPDPYLAGYLIFWREESASGPAACTAPSRVIDGVLFCAVLDPATSNPLVVPAGTNTWADTGTNPGGLYTYAVVAVDLAGNESTAVVVEVNNPLNVALVLDRLGRMARPSGGDDKRSRIEVAQAAAELFLDILGTQNSYRVSSEQKHKAAVVSFGSDVADEGGNPERLRLYEAPRVVAGVANFQPVLRDIARAVEKVSVWTNVTGGLERACGADEHNGGGMLHSAQEAHS